MTVIVARVRHTVDGMFGSLSFNGKPLCVTVERPWKDNKPQVSCIPPGEYPVTRYKSPTKGDVFLLHNVPDRDMIEIHNANVSSQLRGCLAPGKSFALFPDFSNMEGVTNSKMTMHMLLNTLPREFTLTVLDPP